jgi:anti-sigma B factor antagonist
MSTTPAADPRPPGPHRDVDDQQLAVVVVDDGEQIVAHVTGEIDIATCERLRDAIEPHLGTGQRLVLDLSAVTFMDSSCLGVLEQARTTLTSDGGSLILRNPSSVATRLLTMGGMTALFDIETG